MKQLGLWFDAVHEDAYHLFLTVHSNASIDVHVQSVSSIFVVWTIYPPSYQLLNQIKWIPVGSYQVIKTTSSTTFKPPFDIKSSMGKYEKELIQNEQGQTKLVHFVFHKKVLKEEVVESITG